MDAKTVAKCVCIMLIVGGCTTPKFDGFIGRSVDEFVERYGVHLRQHRLANGDVAYLWIEKPDMVKGECHLQVVAGPNGTIKLVSVIRDLGPFGTSTCAERFR